MEISVLQAVSTWIANNWTASAIAGGITWDVSKKIILTPMKNAISKFFQTEDETAKFIETISTTEVVNTNKPYRDIEDIYEDVANREFPTELIDIIKKFFIDNKELIDTMNKSTSGSINVKEQHAGRDINNVIGQQINFNK